MDKILTIGIFATSNPLSREKNENDYHFLKSKGLNIIEQANVRNKRAHLAGTIQERVDGIYELLDNPEVDLLMAYWGGTNTNEMLPYLDYQMIAKYNKPIIGFSDTSALLTAIYTKSGIKTYMGPAGITFDKPEPYEYSFEYFKKIFIDESEKIVIKDSKKYADDLYFLREDSGHRIHQKNVGRKVYSHGKAEGEIFASNLQTLMVLAGTPYFPDLTGKIVFLEEAESANVPEVHRFLTHLTQVVNTNTLKGICIGRFASQTKFKEVYQEEDLYKDVFGDLEIPLVYNLDFGHTDPLFTIPIGGKALVDTHNGDLVIYP